MATSLHKTNDISSDELYARLLQKEEEEKLQQQLRRNGSSFLNPFRNPIRNQIDLAHVQVIQKDEDSDIIVIDDDDFQPIDTTNKNKNQDTEQNEIDVKNDELIARRLQEEFDKELASRLSRNDNPSRFEFGRDNFRRNVPTNNTIQLPDSFAPRTENPNRIPESFETEILFNMARDRPTRTQNTLPNLANRPNIFHNLRHNSNTDPVHDLANAFNFLQNQDFMQEFLNEDQPNPRTRSTNSTTNPNANINNLFLRGGTRASIPANRPNRNVTNFIQSNRGRGRNNAFFGLMANQGDFTADDYENLLRLDDLNGVKKCLNRQEIESLPTFEFKENDSNPDENTCSICFEVYARKEKLTSLTCLHKFHKNCIKEWLKQSRQCPLCKKDAINGN